MNCDKAFERYLELDKHEAVPIGVTLHLLLCPSCRMAVRRISLAERALASPMAVITTGSLSAAGHAHAPNPLASDDPVVREAMRRINAAGLAFPDGIAEEGRVSLSGWLLSGLALAAGFAVVPFSTIGTWSRLVFGTGYMVSYFLLCGVAVTVWCGLFVGTNIDLFVKKFGSEWFA